MPTINQLVRKGRHSTTSKATAPALLKGYNAKNYIKLLSLTKDILEKSIYLLGFDAPERM